MEDSVAGGIHDEVYDQVGSTFFIQVALDICQAHLPSAHGARPRASSCKGDCEKQVGTHPMGMARLDRAQSSLGYWNVSLPMVGGGTG